MTVIHIPCSFCKALATVNLKRRKFSVGCSCGAWQVYAYDDIPQALAIWYGCGESRRCKYPLENMVIITAEQVA